jgi:hypothetical protein
MDGPSWWDYIASKADTYSKQIADLMPSWSSLPPVSNPVVFMLRASDAAMNAGVQISNDFTLKGQGIERFDPLPKDYMPPDEQQSTDIQDRSLSLTVEMYAKRAEQIATDAKNTVTDIFKTEPGAMPLWVKLTIAGALVLGSVVVLQNITGGRRYA